MRLRCCLQTTALAIMLAVWPRPAVAGPAEVLKDIVFHPTDPDRIAVVYAQVGGGLLLTRDGGKTFELLCTAAITGSDGLGGQQWTAAWTEQGSLLVGGFDGLFRSNSGGCGFEAVPELEGLYVRQLINDPATPSTLYAVTASGDADNALFASYDDGASWTVLQREEGASYYNVNVAELPSEGTRLLASLAVTQDSASTFAYVVSNDGGETFTKHDLPRTHSARMLGFDRAQPERAYAAVQWGAGDAVQLLAREHDSSDWEGIALVQSLGSYMLEAEGGLSVVDDKAQRLLRFDADLNEREHDVSAATCISSSGRGASWICQGHLLYRLSDDGTPDEPAALDLNAVSKWVKCDDGSDVAAQCAPALAAGYCTTGHYPASPLCADEATSQPDEDVGDNDSSVDAGLEPSRDGGGAEAPAAGSGGCRASASAPASLTPWLMLAVWLTCRRRHPAKLSQA